MRSPIAFLSLSLFPTAALCAAIPRRSGPTLLSSSAISLFKPFTFFASAAYCSPDQTRNWTCGSDCDAVADFIPTAAGGDGSDVQFWFVGFHPPLNAVVVAHQGTNPEKIVPLILDADAILDDLDPSLFPGAPAEAKAHQGFQLAHARTADDVYNAVQSTLAQFNASSVLLPSHSLGAAISLLDALSLSSRLPSGTDVRFVGYGTPRVGNQAFADYADSVLSGASLTRINNKQDPVPIVPGRFLGFRHPSGEVHITDDNGFLACPGQDDDSSGCTDDTEGSLFSSSVDDHSGPYDGVIIGTCDDGA